MSTEILSAESRDLSYTKGELNKLRKIGKVPAVLFGKGMKSLPLFVNLIEFRKAASHGKIFELKAGEKKHLINAKNIQTNAIGNVVLHIDFLKLSRNVETTVNVPVVLKGEAKGLKAGGLIQIIEENIEVTGIPKNIPESIIIDVTDLDVNESIIAEEIKLGAGIKLEVAPDKTIVTCSMPKVQEEADTSETPEPIVEGQEEDKTEDDKE